MAPLRRSQEHLPVRPLWLCRVCAAPWPCSPARLALRCEYADDRVALCVYLCAVMHEALPDLMATDPELGPQALFLRFVAWAPPRRLT